MNPTLGVLHPGEMGISIAASARNTLGAAYWCSQGRSAATRARAEAHALSEIPDLRDFAATCDIVIGVCPPHAALAQARALIEAGFRGLYVEANAVAPATVRAIGAELAAAVDGGIIGLPAWEKGTTWLYLSGAEAERVAACFAHGPLGTRVLGTEPGQASAFKMCFAAWNKGSTALLTAILGAAEASGVRVALEEQWDIYTPGFTREKHQRITGVARKAWRFGGEMREIAATLDAAGMPGGFFTAAAEIYERQAACKDVAEPPAIEDILRLIGRQA